MRTLKTFLSAALCAAIVAGPSSLRADIRVRLVDEVFNGRTNGNSGVSLPANALHLNRLPSTAAPAVRFNRVPRVSMSGIPSRGFSGILRSIAGKSGGWLRSHGTRFGLLGLGALTAAGIAGCGGGGGSHGGGSVPCDNALDITNTTALETFDVYVNGIYRTSIEAGYTKGLCFNSGTYTVDIYEAYSGDLLLSDVVSFSGTGWDIGWTVNDPYESEMDVDNLTGGFVELYVDSIWFDDVPTGYWAYPVREGSHSVELVDYEDGDLLYYSASDFFWAGLSYLYTVTDPACVELDIYNGTGESVYVYIDSSYQGSQSDGSTYAYFMDENWHSVQVEAVSDGWSFYNSSDFYSCGTYTLDVF